MSKEIKKYRHRKIGYVLEATRIDDGTQHYYVVEHYILGGYQADYPSIRLSIGDFEELFEPIKDMRLSEKNPWELQHYRDALVEGHAMSDLEIGYHLAEIKAAIEESITHMRAERNAQDAYGE